MVPLLGWRDETTVGYSRWGAGEVIVLAGGWPLSNQGLKVRDNLILVLNALEHRDPSHKLAITFDEYHHGYGEGKGMASLISLPAKLGLAQIVLAFLILVFATSRRFGRVITLREGARQRGEYLSSMSALLKKARATEIVRVELGKRFISDAAVALGLSPSAGPDEIIEAATRRRPEKLAELQQLLATVATAAGDDETRILTLAIRWHRMRKELQR